MIAPPKTCHAVMNSPSSTALRMVAISGSRFMISALRNGPMRLIEIGSRTIETAEGGDPAGIPVIVHHGTPGAAVLHPGWEPPAAAEGLRLVTYSRKANLTGTRTANARD